MKNRLNIVGAGGHGTVVAEAAQLAGNWRSIQFLDDDHANRGSTEGVTVVGATGDLKALSAPGDEFIVAVGDNRRRLQIHETLIGEGLSAATVIHPSAVVSPSVDIKSGSVILAGAIVNARTVIGSAAIINTASSVDHDCILGDGVHVSPGAHLAGSVSMGNCAWFGIGAVGLPGANIGDYAIVGAGAVVVSDANEGTTVIGVPARPVGESKGDN